MRNKKPIKHPNAAFVLVQHSKWVCERDGRYRFALDVRGVSQDRARELVKFGVFPYPTFELASKAAIRHSYPDNNCGDADCRDSGRFIEAVVDNLKVFVLNKEKENAETV